ncbi:MAG TPA: hypothetical protein VF796_26795 [Humisphaera sp.]
MPGTLTEFGDATTTAAGRGGRVTADNLEPVADLTDLLDEFARQHDHLSQCGVAGLLGWPEQTFRRYREGHNVPAYDRLAVALQRPGCEWLLFAVLTRLAGGKCTVSRADPAPAVAVRDQAARLRELAIDAARGPLDVAQEINEGLADGRLDATELARIHGRTAAGRSKLDEIDATAAAVHRRTAAGR